MPTEESPTETDVREIQAQYRARRARQLALAVPAVVVIALLAWVGDDPDALGVDEAVVKVAGLAVVGVVLGISYWNWRCPACRKYLGKGISHRFCEGCGVELSSGKSSLADVD